MIAKCLSVNEAGHLEISGCDTVDLAEQYGTPLYVMSEDEKTTVGTGSPFMPAKLLAAKKFTALFSVKV